MALNDVKVGGCGADICAKIWISKVLAKSVMLWRDTSYLHRP